MRLNKILKWMIIVHVITITACSLDKNIIRNKNNKQKNIDNDFIGVNNEKNTPVVEQVHLQIQKLQQDNIIYFELNKYNIRSEFLPMIDNHASFLRSNPSYKVTIEGHSDERGTSEYNISLGERRANSVKIYLQSKGVSNDQISIISYGKEKPVMLGHNETAYTKNRRAVIVY